MALVAVLVLAGCGGKAPSSGGGSSEGGELTLWTHNAGNKEELAIVNQIVSDYNASQTKNKVKVQAFPQAAYNDAVTAAATSARGFAATAGEYQHSDQRHYTGPCEGPRPTPSHDRFLRSTARLQQAGDERSRQRSLGLWGSAPPLMVHPGAAGRPIFGESAALRAAPVSPLLLATP